MTALTWLTLQLRSVQKGPSGRSSMANAKRLAHTRLRLNRFIVRLVPDLEQHQFPAQIQELLQYGIIASENT